MWEPEASFYVLVDSENEGSSMTDQSRGGLWGEQVFVLAICKMLLSSSLFIIVVIVVVVLLYYYFIIVIIVVSNSTETWLYVVSSG